MPPAPTIAAASNQGPIKVPDASTKGGQYRIAGRRLVTTFLNSVLVLDTQISCFDLHMFSGKYALCTGKLIHIYSVARGAITATLGNTVGHRSEIRSCGFNATGSLLITGGEDGRIVIWNLAKQRTERIINAHKGNVYMVRFTSDDMQFLSSGDDGRIVLWECGPNNATFSTNFQHPSPVRSFAFCDMHGSRMLSARADGVVDAWDTTGIRILDSILPESDWQERELLSQLGNSGHALAILAMLQAKDAKAAHANRDREHHAGSILHVTLSPNTRYLATCSTDKTCKLWDIATYMKDDKDVQEVVPDRTHPINVWDESVGQQVVDGELHVGNVDIKLGYHADLLFTLQHEEPVVCAVFTALSDMVITSSLDCTVRFWSVRRGNLLFQINTPSPVHQLIVDGDNTLYAICGIRLMIFKFRAAKEKDALAELEEQRLQSLQEAQKAREAQVTDPSQRFKALLNQSGSGAEGEDPDGPERA
ncbi:WD40-repeat-containing domain protein [Catenaria anguillulae PL171]|uniref:WD40-repeat-containing domain protein n=1 Tax=Catenaria anguillulae PL171 TaxID=765915 RepID=A0A1Y2HP43_9FUNG|nr:WD40-repeat-containing domain protein [Catenaria anguillulae PL171]